MGRKGVKMLKFLCLIGVQAFVLRDRYMTNYLIGKKLGIDGSSRAMMAMMMRDKTSSPMNLLPFLYKTDDDDDHGISLEALYLFNYIGQHDCVERRNDYLRIPVMLQNKAPKSLLMLHLLDMESVSLENVLPFFAHNMDRQNKLLLMILVNLLSNTNHPEANLIEQQNLLLPLMAENCNGNQKCEDNKNDLFLLSMIMESKTRGIRQDELLPLLMRSDQNKYELMFFTMMMNERKVHCQSVQTPHYFKSEIDMHAGTDFTPIFIRPENEPDVIFMSDRPTPPAPPVPTPSSYSVDSGSGNESGFQYFMHLVDLFEKIETEPTPNPDFVSYVGSMIKHH